MVIVISHTYVLRDVRKLAFALKFKIFHLRNLFSLLYEAAIFSELKVKAYFIESHVVHCKDEPYPSI